MMITVRPVGIIRKYCTEHQRSVAEGVTSRQLIEMLDIPRKLKMVTFVNGMRVSLDEKLKDGDEIILTTLLTGG